VEHAYAVLAMLGERCCHRSLSLLVVRVDRQVRNSLALWKKTNNMVNQQLLHVEARSKQRLDYHEYGTGPKD
jgi:hypothetical protein